MHLKPPDRSIRCAEEALPWVRMLCILGLIWLAPLSRANGSEVFLDYHNTPWSLQQGAPADIWALAQAADGYLWLGTGFGLYRFDGQTFEPVRFTGGQHLLSSNVTALTILPDGDVWIGYYLNGVSRLHNGQITHYGRPEGVSNNIAYRIVRDTAGVIWLAGADGLFFFEGGRWHMAGPEIGFPEHHAVWLICDSHGTLWIADRKTILYRPAGEARFRSTGVAVPGSAVIQQDLSDKIWISDARAGTRPLATYGADGHSLRVLPKSVAPGLEKVCVKRLLFRRDGTIWGTDADNGGVFLARPEGRGDRYHVEWFHRRDGLTSDNVVPIIEDQEENIWVGTNMGLNRFRRQGVVMLRGFAGFHPAGFGLLNIRSDGVTIIGGHGRLAANRGLLESMLGTDMDAQSPEPLPLYRLSPRQRAQIFFGAPVPTPPEGLEDLAAAVDASGTPWISIVQAGVLRLQGGHWVHDPRLPQRDATVIAPADGSVWFGYNGSLAIRLDASGAVTRYTPVDGLSVGNVTAIHDENSSVIIAGEQGLALEVGDRFHVLTGDVFTGITGIASGPGGCIWLNGSKGILRMSLESLKKAVLSSERPSDYLLFDAYDGLAGVALQDSPMPTAARGADGLLWFSTSQGIAVVDPKHLVHNPIPPHVTVRRVIADDLAYAATAPLKLPSGTNRVEIDYTATSLSIPERVRFKFRMDGADSEWREAGNRREAFYTNLGPGQYRFHVIAANNDGVWNEQGAAVELTIAPTFFQTPAFALLCIFGVLLIVCTGYLLHMRQLAARVQVRLEERHMERERIARELHDTLLQGFQGLILRMHALVTQLHEDEPRKPQMEEAIDQAEALMVEGRDSVRGLRTVTHYRDLASALMAIGKELVGEEAPSLGVTVSGSHRPLKPLVHDELYRIAREAILNARRHGQPTRINVALYFGDHAFQLCVSDDGKGMDPQLLDSPPAGHWGLYGMRERAHRIGARLQILAPDQGGVRITAVLTAKTAYKSELGRGFVQRVQAMIRLQ